MTESMAPDHVPTENLLKVYSKWADGGWGMILTGNVQVSQLYHGSSADVEVPAIAADNELEMWKKWAAACQRSGTPAIVQLCHPGRQSPLGAGRRGFFSKNIAPSPVHLDLGDGLLACAASSFLFGTPREITAEEIEGPDGVIEQFVAGAMVSFKAGFSGVELHAAHGYLLAQFLSPKTNLRADEFGGTAIKRAEVLLRIIRRVRAVTSPKFCIGVKLNSVDVSSQESLPEFMTQIQLIIEAGIDFVEISGGSYENFLMFQSAHTDPSAAFTANDNLRQRESFFLYFAQTLRQRFPSVVLMVTGGFRSRIGMEEAIRTEDCDLVGLGRPAAAFPKLPKDLIFNKAGVSDEMARVDLQPEGCDNQISYSTEGACFLQLMSHSTGPEV